MQSTPPPQEQQPEQASVKTYPPLQPQSSSLTWRRANGLVAWVVVARVRRSEKVDDIFILVIVDEIETG